MATQKGLLIGGVGVLVLEGLMSVSYVMSGNVERAWAFGFWILLTGYILGKWLWLNQTDESQKQDSAPQFQG